MPRWDTAVTYRARGALRTRVARVEAIDAREAANRAGEAVMGSGVTIFVAWAVPAEGVAPDLPKMRAVRQARVRAAARMGIRALRAIRDTRGAGAVPPGWAARLRQAHRDALPTQMEGTRE